MGYGIFYWRRGDGADGEGVVPNMRPFSAAVPPRVHM